MSKKLYVGNLPYETTEAQVREIFVPHGDIESVAMITDRETGRFRGFCFVEMTDAGATAAIAALDGKEYGGRSLRVNEARPKEEGGGRRGGFGGGDRAGGERRGGDRRSGDYRGGDRRGADRNRSGFGGGERRGRDRW